jgi:hypothetical protein
LRQRHVFACQAYPARPAAGRRWFARTRLPCSPNMPPLYDFKHPRSPTHERGGANLIDIPDPKEWWSLSGSNRRPEACKATALPAELRPRFSVWPQAPAKASAFLASRAIRRGGRSAFARRWRSLRRVSVASPTGRPRRCAEQPRQRTLPPALEAPNNGGPGTTRTSDLTLIRGAL